MSYEVNNTKEQSQQFMLDEFRERTVFSLLPIIIVDDLFVWTGKWGKYVKIKEQKYKYRYTKFDDGWTYLPYWTEWKTGWQFVKIL